MTVKELEKISERLAAEPELEFAVLIGSRAGGSARPESDGDIAIQWQGPPSFMRCVQAHAGAGAEGLLCWQERDE